MSASIVYVCDECGVRLDTKILDTGAARTLAHDTGWQTGHHDYCDHDRADDDLTCRQRKPSIEGSWDSEDDG